VIGIVVDGHAIFMNWLAECLARRSTFDDPEREVVRPATIKHARLASPAAAPADRE
jgi:hypothetical protein